VSAQVVQVVLLALGLMRVQALLALLVKYQSPHTFKPENK
jgi:hypothetical protein